MLSFTWAQAEQLTLEGTQQDKLYTMKFCFIAYYDKNTKNYPCEKSYGKLMFAGFQMSR